MIPAELLRNKRDGKELTTHEINFFVEGIVRGSVSQAQAGAFLMAACTKGLSPQEIGALTMAMAKSGKQYSFSSPSKRLIDKHSTGGVGDKLSLLIAPLVAGCGVQVPMMSGRGLGHTGGTVDKLESILNFKMDYNEAELAALLNSHNCFMIKQTADVAPADGILYALRDVTGTVESTGLITASILSKKIAEGLDGLVLDMKVGNGAFMQTLSQAHELAESMFRVAKEIELPMRILFTKMDEPLGYAVGNWLEIVECETSLQNIDATPMDVRTITTELSARMLMVGLDLPLEEATQRINESWRTGKAHTYFHTMIQAQGGNYQASLAHYQSTASLQFLSTQNGYISGFDTRDIGIACITLGAGRKVQTDSIDYSAGVLFHKKVGDDIQKGEPLFTVYGSKTELFTEVAETIHSCIHVAQELTPATNSWIIEEWAL